jgi:hypothetical protein
VSCANCGRSFTGRFCPDCGQEAIEIRRPVSGLVHDFLSDSFAFDARIWRTFPLLIQRPGSLAADYVSGRRARYVPPLRLYIFLSALFFAVLALSDGGPVRFASTRDGDQVTIVSAFGVRINATGVSAAAEGSFASEVSHASGEVERLNDVVIATLSYVHFLLIPVLVLLLRLLWRRRWYAEHLVFGMYFGAFALLAGSVVVLVYALIGNPHPTHPAARIALAGWYLVLLLGLYRALREMYAAGRLGTIARLLILVPSYFTIASLAIIVIVFVTIRVVY